MYPTLQLLFNSKFQNQLPIQKFPQNSFLHNSISVRRISTTFPDLNSTNITMSSSIEEEESLEHTLLVVREVSIFKIPPRSFSGGYKCGEWLQSGELFAACFVLPGQRENSVETVLDSSRYFVLKIEDGRGKHAFIGLWFNERNEAFDFNVALSDQEKHVKRETDKDGAGDSDKDGGDHIDIHPAVNHRLKEQG